MNISKAVKDNLEQLSDLLGNPKDLVTEAHGLDDAAGLAYLSSLTDHQDIQANLLQPLMPLLVEPNLSIDKVHLLLPKTTPHRRLDLETAASDLLEGRTVVFLKGQTAALGFATPGWAKHPIKEPTSERVIRGPREGFTETIDENIGMIRRWIKDPRLRVDPMELGRSTKTQIAVMYLSEVAQPRLVKEVWSRLEAIDIDGIIESGYIEQLIKDRRASIYPLTQATERSDKVASAILEGRVAIFVDKSPFVILVPVTVNELYQSPEDYYFDFWLGSFLRLGRLISNNLAVALPGLYVALVTINPELLPTQLALAIASSRMKIPFPLIIEVLLLELAVEVFREAGLRIPGTVGETLGVVSGVVLGLVGVQSGLVSPVTVVIVAITAIASFSGPNYSVGIAWRLLKYILLFAGTFLGLFGVTIAGILILTHAADVKSFGVSYLAPWAPLQWREMADAPLRAPFWFRWLRPATYRPQDKLRSGGTKKEDETHE
ncbi:MAG TPA: spore germination protein [Bacillota bacterium]|nr:spore germination protein [Bacillota bacterium]